MDSGVAATDSFGNGFYLARKEEWTDYYIHYHALMEFLEEMKRKYEEEQISRLRRGRTSHASTFFLLGLNPYTVGETEELSIQDSFDGSGHAMIKRMSEGALTLTTNKFQRSRLQREEQLSPGGSKGELWSLDSAENSINRGSSVGPVKPDSDQANFCARLDDELEKVGLFFLQEQGRVSAALLELAHQNDKIRIKQALSSGDTEEEFHVAASDTETLVEEYRTVGRDVLELFHFVAINMTVLRKLLNRHDAIVRRGLGEKPPLLRQWYVLSRTEDKQAYLRTLLSHNGLMALEGTIRRVVSNMIPSLYAMDGIETHETRDNEEAWGRSRKFDVDYLMENIEAVSAKMKRAEKRSFKDFVVEGSVGNGITFEPTILRNRFHPVMDQGDTDMQFYVDWRERERQKATTNRDDGNKPNEDNTVWPLGLQLNLFSTFLYMVNYFIAGPTSVKYMKALGGHGALASMIIGATPWAVMLSTFIFSIWTNYSFKKPLVMSGFLLCLGNFMYASALHFDSIFMVMAGRMVIGFGGPRLINRRYIADTATIQQRTAVSAAFVTFSASGTAVGPGLSVLLQHINTTIHVPVLGRMKVNGLTAPGFFMLGLWLIFFIVILVSFEEPVRTGLEQQKNLPTSLGIEKKDVDHESKDEDCLLTSDAGSRRGGYGSNLSDEETTNLVSSDEGDVHDESDAWCWMKITWPVVLCLLLLFVDKLAIESLISSAPIITDNRYDWSVHRIGALGIIIGLLVIPLSICVGWLSRRYEDGRLLLWLLYFTSFGLFLLLDVSQLGGASRVLTDNTLYGVGPHRYVYGCLFSFSGLQAKESIIMSTLSKVVPFSLAAGTCNSGLLNTEIGTFGRAFGDLVVTLIGLVSLENLLDLLVTPLLLLMVGCIILVTLNYEIFRV